MKWRVVLEPDSDTGDWAVWCPELPGCTSAGASEEEALANIQEAIALYIEPFPPKLGNFFVGVARSREAEKLKAFYSNQSPLALSSLKRSIKPRLICLTIQ